MSITFPWRANPHSREDVERAERLLGERDALPFWAWAALVWKWTDVATCYVAVNSGGKATGIARNAQEGVVYRAVTEIAGRGKAWDRASGGLMGQWIFLLQDRMLREYALRAYGSYADGPDATDEELARQRKSILAQVRTSLPAQKSLPAVVGSVPALTEPTPEQAAKEAQRKAELRAQIAEQTAHPDLVGEFYGSPASQGV